LSADRTISARLAAGCRRRGAAALHQLWSAAAQADDGAGCAFHGLGFDAEALVVSTRTGKAHAEHIRDELGVGSRAEIAAWITAHRPGLGPAHPAVARTGAR